MKIVIGDISYPLMNDTKWREIRQEVLNMGISPKYRKICLDNGHVSEWDREWFHHFYETSYAGIERCEIVCTSEGEYLLLRNILCKVGVPGEVIENGFVIYGYGVPGKQYEFIEK